MGSVWKLRRYISGEADFWGVFSTLIQFQNQMQIKILPSWQFQVNLCPEGIWAAQFDVLPVFGPVATRLAADAS